MYEALGFAEYGKGTELAKSGHTSIQGRLPTNTGGGLIGYVIQTIYKYILLLIILIIGIATINNNTNIDQ